VGSNEPLTRDGEPDPFINAALTTGSNTASALRLAENANLRFMGTTKVGHSTSTPKPRAKCRTHCQTNPLRKQPRDTFEPERSTQFRCCEALGQRSRHHSPPPRHVIVTDVFEWKLVEGGVMFGHIGAEVDDEPFAPAAVLSSEILPRLLATNS